MHQPILENNHDYSKSFEKFLKDNNYEGSADLKQGKHYLKVVGKSAHGSTPQFGENAIDRMMSYLLSEKLGGHMLLAYEKLLLNDYLGEKLGVSYEDEEMGELTNNVGVFYW